MRDEGLNAAIRAAGGVSELARQLSISQPSVSNWTRIPAERVVAVETATGVDRAILRPDLYGENASPAEVDDVEMARAHEYALIAALLARAPDQKLLDSLAQLRGDASPLGLAHVALAEAAAATDAQSIEHEYFDLFIGLGRGELLPYGSYYLTGFLHERPLARLRGDLRALGIARADGVAEPEDGIASLCEIMAALIGGAFAAPAPLAGQRAFFRGHVEPWAARFFADLAEAPSGDFYRAVAELGRVFIDIESESFSISD